MEFDIIEDIPEELEDFIFLSRLGLYEEAQGLFEQNLERHLDFFPIVAEYSDMLLEKGSYELLSSFLTKLPANTIFSEDQNQLLKLIKALSDAHIEQKPKLSGMKRPLDGADGYMKAALKLAQDWHDNLRKSPNDFNDLDVSC